MLAEKEQLSLVQEITIFVSALKDTGIWDILLIVIPSALTWFITWSSVRKKIILTTNNFEYGKISHENGESLYPITFDLHILNVNPDAKQFTLCDDVELINNLGLFKRIENRKFNLARLDNLCEIRPNDTTTLPLTVYSSVRSPKKIKIYFEINGKRKSRKCRIPYVNTGTSATLGLDDLYDL